MAARIEAPPPAYPAQVVDLRHVSSRLMEPLLEEETAEWRRDLEWDFEKSADLVRRFVDLHALNGCALVEGGEVTGYGYYVLEEHKGLIGDLYVRERWRAAEREDQLLEWVLEAIARTPAVERIESQLMMMDSRRGRPVPMKEYLSAYERNFMRVELACALLGEGRVRRPVYVEKWSDHYHDEAARLIAAAYAGHVDSLINDQYRSGAGARRFLYNIVQYPGCGTFHRPASYAAFDGGTGQMAGICLASMVAEGCGHITQICVGPRWKGTGVGHLLLRHSLTTLRDQRCGSASLTVTASNAEAVSLYERVGFRTERRFFAWVWEGF
jgi:ribosomal protein S18 acetylase RimI-like enzyme